MKRETGSIKHKKLCCILYVVCFGLHNARFRRNSVKFVQFFGDFRDISGRRLDRNRDHSRAIFDAMPLNIHSQPRQDQMSVVRENFIYLGGVHLAVLDKNRDCG